MEAKELQDRNSAIVAALADISSALAERQATLEGLQQQVRCVHSSTLQHLSCCSCASAVLFSLYPLTSDMQTLPALGLLHQVI